MKYQKKYWTLLAILFLITTLAVGLIGGAAVVHWSNRAGSIVILILITAGWVAYKKISRSYQEGRLLDDAGRIQALHKDESESSPATGELNDAPANLSRKDKIRRQQIKNQRRKNK
ncbi:hypothetical protein KRX54_05990 [Actinomycetaceae bacterium TAE3-ERU4]|nr:hypothetical protein [Actinomycetaceae bacterium TAE3-ERU4]